MAVKGNPFAVVFLLCFACHFFESLIGKHSGTAKAEEKAERIAREGGEHQQLLDL